LSNSIHIDILDKFTTFGDLLRFLRRRAGMTQVELSIAVGYSSPQISRLEQNMRLPDLPTIEARFVPVLCLEDQPEAVARLLELASAVRREDSPASGMCPYKGLDYFDEPDADLFVGREALTEKLTNRVLALVSRNDVNHGRFFAVVGASGSGKSSLVRAGLVPALRWNKTSASWPIIVLTPNAHPLESLASTITSENPSLIASTTLMDDMANDPRSLSLFLKRMARGNAGYFLLVIDQFEELFSLCRSDDERSSFIDNLMACAMEEDGKGIVIITLRSDFYTHCAAYPQLRLALARQQEFIGTMSVDEMRRAIEEPALRGRWEFEAGLVDLILHDVGQEPGSLPLLSHALLETWQRRHGRKLTLSGYNSAGGVRGAIAETAEAVFTDQLTPVQQAIARRIFLRLTELGDESSAGDTRRRATYSELILRPEESEDTNFVIKTLADARLVTTSEDGVQVAHEALIREWPTLRAWLEENRDGLRLHRQLTQAAQEWSAAGNEPDLLYRGARLVQAREWSISHGDDLNSLEKDFLAASLAFSEKEVAERQEQQQRELEIARKLAETEKQRAEEGLKSARRLQRRSIVASVVGVLAILLAVLAVVAWQRSASQAAINQSLNLASAAQQVDQTGQGDLALALALESVKINQPPLESLNALRSIALGNGTRMLIEKDHNAVTALTISADGKTLLSGSCISPGGQNNCLVGELTLWDATSNKELHRWSAHTGFVTAVAFSQDGQSVVSGSTDGYLIQWDLDGKLIRQLSGHRGSITNALLVPGTNTLLSGSADGYLILWDLSTGNVLERYNATGSPVTALALTSDGSTAVSAHEDRFVRVWDLSRRDPAYEFISGGAEINSIAISPNKRWIIFPDNEIPYLSLRMINALDGSLLNKYQLDCTPGEVAFSPDGSYALITCSTMIIELDVQNWNITRRYSGHGDVFNTISISPDGNLGLTSSTDGSIRLWNLNDQLDYQVDTIDADKLNSMAITSDGKFLILSDNKRDGFEAPTMWDITQKKGTRTYYPEAILSMNSGDTKISSDNRFIAAIGIQKSSGISYLMVWDVESQALICNVHEFDGSASALAISPDNQHLLVSTQVTSEPFGQLLLFNIQTCEIVQRFDSNESVTSIAYNSDGTRFITGSGLSGSVILWDVATGKEIRRYSYTKIGLVQAVAFGPGDNTILGSGLGEIFLWDVSTGNLLKRYTGLSTFPASFVVSQDGKFLLSGTTNGELVLWDFLSGEELHRINTHLAISSVVFSPDGKTAYATALEGKLIELHIDEKSLPELLNWIKANRYVRELTCEERQQYHVNPQCKP
jgi:WD40 repeat protein